MTRCTCEQASREARDKALDEAAALVERTADDAPITEAFAVYRAADRIRSLKSQPERTEP